MVKSLKKNIMTLLVLLVGGLCFAAGLAADECLDYGDFLGWGGTFDFGGFKSREIEESEGLIYAAVSNTISIVDVSREFDPQMIGRYIFNSSTVRALAVREHQVFALAGGFRRFYVVDVSDPVNPFLAGNIQLDYSGTDVVVRGDLAYVASGGGLQVVDVSNPDSLKVVNIIDVAGTDIEIDGNLAFLGDFGGFKIVDVSDPENGEILGEIYGIGGPFFVDDGMMYVASDKTGLSAIDVSDPRNPVMMGQMPGIRYAEDITVENGLAYVAGFEDGVLVADVSDPTHMEILEIIDDFGGKDWEGSIGVAVAGTEIYLLNEIQSDSQLHIINFDRREKPPVRDELDLETRPRNLMGNGSLAFVAYEGDTDSLSIFEVEEDGTLAYRGGTYTPGYVRDVEVVGDAAFVVTEEYFASIDISDVTNPILQSSRSILGEGRSVAVSGDHAVVASFHEGLRIFDISDPTLPSPVGDYIGILGYTFDVAASGSFAYVASGSQLAVVDISDPRQGNVVGELATVGGTSIVVNESQVFLSSGHSGNIYVIDVSTPSAPLLVDTVSIFEYVGMLSVVEGDVYLYSNYGVLTIEPDDAQGYSARAAYTLNSVSDYVITPNMFCAFIKIGFETQLRSLWLPCAEGVSRTVYPGDADNSGVVDALDVLPLGVYFLEQGPARAGASLAWTPQTAEPWSYPTSVYADTDGNGVIDEQDLFAIGLNWGKTHDQGSSDLVMDPQDAQILSGNREAFTALFQALSGQGEAASELKALLAEVLDLDSTFLPAKLVVHQNYPNPFNPSTTVEFELPRAATVTLEVFDVSGKLVKTVVRDKPYNPGLHAVELTTDKLGSGVYFYRLGTHENQVINKMTILK